MQFSKSKLPSKRTAASFIVIVCFSISSDESKGDKSSKKKVSKRNSGGGRGSVTAPSCVSAQVYMGL